METVVRETPKGRSTIKKEEHPVNEEEGMGRETSTPLTHQKVHGLLCPLTTLVQDEVPATGGISLKSGEGSKT